MSPIQEMNNAGQIVGWYYRILPTMNAGHFFTIQMIRSRNQ